MEKIKAFFEAIAADIVAFLDYLGEKEASGIFARIAEIVKKILGVAADDPVIVEEEEE